MKNLCISRAVLCLMLGLCPLFFFPPAAGAAGAGNPHLLLFLADTTGTMLDDLKAAEEESETSGTKHKEDDGLPERKLDLMKHLLVRASEKVPCPLGIWNIRYIGGNSRNYMIFLPHESGRNLEDRRSYVQEKFPEDYPLFNRRTPLGGLFRQLDEDRLADFMKQESATATIVLLSDGIDSFSDYDEDAEISRDDEDIAARVKEESEEKDTEDEEESGGKPDGPDGPLTQVRLLREKYGDRFVLHTILVDRPDKDNQEPAPETGEFYRGEDSRRKASGENRLRRLAYLGGGDHLTGEDLFRDPALLASFCGRLCADTGPAPVPVPVPVPAPAPRPGDADGDGVMDPDDGCPDTPAGAVVDARGCWTLPGVLFATDRWEIRPQFAARLEQALIVLKRNPDLRVLVSGHTDSRASEAHNQVLSERRAASVRAWFMERGIAPGRIETAGHGELKPVADNATKHGRRLNRRVELAPLP